MLVVKRRHREPTGKASTEFADFETNRKSDVRNNKNFSRHLKRLSNKYRKNSKNSTFNKILELEREKDKEGFEKSANFAQSRKY